MRTIFVRVTSEASPSYAPVQAQPITSTTFSIERVHPDFTDAALEFVAGDSVRCRMIRLRGPGETTPRQRMIAVERVADGRSQPSAGERTGAGGSSGG